VGSNKIALLLAAAVTAGPVVANAASTTYDYTGTVTAATGVYSSAASTVSGTITINFGAASTPTPFPTDPIGGTYTWETLSEGGTFFQTPSPVNLVFSQTLTSGGVSYSTSVSSGYTESYIEGQPADNESQAQYDMDVSVGLSSLAKYTSIGLVLYGASPPWDSNGLPVLGNADHQLDSLGEYVNGNRVGYLAYHVTSLTAVPLPTAAWFMLSGLCGLAALARKNPAV